MTRTQWQIERLKKNFRQSGIIRDLFGFFIISGMLYLLYIFAAVLYNH